MGHSKNTFFTQSSIFDQPPSPTSYFFLDPVSLNVNENKKFRDTWVNENKINITIQRKKLTEKPTKTKKHNTKTIKSYLNYSVRKKRCHLVHFLHFPGSYSPMFYSTLLLSKYSMSNLAQKGKALSWAFNETFFQSEQFLKTLSKLLSNPYTNSYVI